MNVKKLNPEKYDSDKKLMPHYIKNYEDYFFTLKDHPVRLLELGVFNGGSVKMWRDYFEKGVIIGLDSNNISIDDSDRIYLYQGLQEDKTLLDEIRNDHAPTGFDIVIDDCAHIAKYARTSFWHLFDNHLKSGGIYVIEDWGTGYWPDWPDGEKFIGTLGADTDTPINHSAGMVGLIKELIDECGASDITGNPLNELPPRLTKFEKIIISPSHCFIYKNKQ